MMSIERLGNQFREFLQEPVEGESTSHLVPNIWGNWAYDSSSCLGRFWSFFWAIISLLDWNDGWKDAALFNVIKMTHDVWVEKKGEIEESLETFFAHLDHISEPQEGAFIEQVKKAQSNLSSFTGYLRRAFDEEGRGCLEEKALKIRRVFEDVLDIQEEQDISCLLQEVQSAYSIIRLEKKMKGCFPLVSLSRLAKREELNAEDYAEMSVFVSQIKTACENPEERKRVGIRELHLALKTLAEHLEPAADDGLSAIEWPLHQALLDQGCSVFLEQDPEHQRWALMHAASEYSFVNCQGTLLLLGEQLARLRSETEDKHLVFEYDESSVAVFSLLNQSSLRLEWLEAQGLPSCLPLPRLIAFDDQCALYEKVSEDIRNGSWYAGNDMPRFIKRYDSLVAFIQCMIKEKFTPRDFSAEWVRFDQADELKLLKPLPRGEFDLDCIRAFVRDCAFTDQSLYLRMLQEAGLASQLCH